MCRIKAFMRRVFTQKKASNNDKHYTNTKIMKNPEFCDQTVLKGVEEQTLVRRDPIHKIETEYMLTISNINFVLNQNLYK